MLNYAERHYAKCHYTEYHYADYKKVRWFSTVIPFQPGLTFKGVSPKPTLQATHWHKLLQGILKGEVSLYC